MKTISNVYLKYLYHGALGYDCVIDFLNYYFPSKFIIRNKRVDKVVSILHNNRISLHRITEIIITRVGSSYRIECAYLSRRNNSYFITFTI